MRISDWSSDVCSSDLARRVCLYSSLAYTVGVLSLIPGIICALIIGFNYLNEQSVRRFEQDAEFAMGFTFFACVALLPLLCFIVYRKMKPKMEAAIEDRKSTRLNSSH